MATNGAFTFQDIYNMKVPMKKLYIRFLEEFEEKMKEKREQIEQRNSPTRPIPKNITSIYNK